MLLYYTILYYIKLYCTIICVLLVPTSVLDDEATQFYPAGTRLTFEILEHSFQLTLHFLLVHFILHYRAVIPERPKLYILQGFGASAAQHRLLGQRYTDHMPDTQIKPEQTWQCA